MKKLNLRSVVFGLVCATPMVFAEEVFVACPPDKFPICSSVNHDAGVVVEKITSPPKEREYFLRYAGESQTTYQATYKISGGAPSVGLICAPTYTRSKPRCCTNHFSPNEKAISGGIKCNPGETLRVSWRNYSSDEDTYKGQILVTKTAQTSDDKRKKEKVSNRDKKY